MKKIIRYFTVMAAFGMAGTSCSKYLDVVPEGTSQLKNAFTSKTPALRYLSTCYSYLPTFEDGSAVDITGSDEVWMNPDMFEYALSLDGCHYAEGLQTALSPIWNKWPTFYQALRDCNIFIDNIDNVPDMPPSEKRQWKAEAKVLKAYYHFLLMRQYGPAPIIRENLPVSTDVAAVRVARDKVDDMVNYAVELIDEALPDLRSTVLNVVTELGRITIPIALTIKAQIYMTAASPLFNGNTMFASLKNNGDDTPLINDQFDIGKWQKAVEACEAAIEACNSAGIQLYIYPGHKQFNLTDTIMSQMTLRNAFTERWNSEIIWGDTKARASYIQTAASAKLDTQYPNNSNMHEYFGPPLKIAEMFYSDHGIPLKEDKTWNYTATRYDLRTATTDEALYIAQGTQTSRLNFDREPRYYAWLGFDNGVWYGQGRYDDSNPAGLFVVHAKNGQLNSMLQNGGTMTGYLVKKWVNFENVQDGDFSYSVNWYAWPRFRLADLYLLYAEALNEAADNAENRATAIEYINKVRQRASLEDVETSWSQYAAQEFSNKYTTQSGLRDIIRHERMIELCFEQKRFWDIRRWMTVAELYQTPIQGWSSDQKDAASYYVPKTIFQQTFSMRDYFWPIPSAEVTGNPNLVQNIGW